jgi:predicted AAA+ superfamily ATPase
VKQKLVFFGGRGKQARVRCDILPISSYSVLNNPIAYWKTASGFEVDFVLGDHELAVEVKSASMVGNRHLKGIRAFKEEYAARHYIFVSMDPKPRKTTDGIDILPWNIFLGRLWKGGFFQTS